MPPREPQLPEGTDHVINGAMETGDSAAGSGSGARARGGKGFIGSSDAGGAGDDTGGAVTAGNGSGGGTMAKAFSDGTANLKRQATDRVRQFADDGKSRASDALDEVARAVEEAAEALEERLGEQYGGYARRAAEKVSGIATTLREREVEELYEDARDFVRTSPILTVGAAAAIGFALIRLVRAGMPSEEEAPAPRGRGSRTRKKGA
jgi:ElaB/YqjD/DUF883 family membrane-anchored ribosome-binding protein